MISIQCCARWFRHPSYAGFFYWALGTQMMLQNPVSFIGFAILLWRFFYQRTRGLFPASSSSPFSDYPPQLKRGLWCSSSATTMKLIGVGLAHGSPLFRDLSLDWLVYAVIYHAGGIMKWHGMRDHTKLLEITAYLTWLLSMVPNPCSFNTSSVRDHHRPV